MLDFKENNYSINNIVCRFINQVFSLSLFYVLLKTSNFYFLGQGG